MSTLWKRFAALGTIALLAVAAAACGGDDDGNIEPDTSGDTTQAPGNGDEWKGSFETGTEVSAKLFVPATDPGVAKFEELRKAAGAPAVVYARVVAKNTGKVADTARFLVLTDKEGQTLEEDAIELNFACLFASRWAQAANLPASAISVYTGLYNTECRGASHAGTAINAGETFTYFVAIEAGAEPEFERVFVGAGRELKK